MKYITETGIILSVAKDIIHVVEGHAGYVDFPPDVIKRLHYTNPGSIFAFAHTHPAKMTQLSTTDQGMLKAWTRVMFPFAARLITVAEISSNIFQTSVYLGVLESKFAWEQRGKENSRRFEILQEKTKLFVYPINLSIPEERLRSEGINPRAITRASSWERVITQKSYIVNSE